MNQSTILISAKFISAILLALASIGFASSALAGRSCEDKPLEIQEISQGMDLASKTLASLNQSGAQVVMLARAGQDLSKYGLRYSHMGIAYRSADNTWRVAHKLNQCGTAEASVYRQGLGDFFLDRPFRYEAAYLIPTSAVQDQLLKAISNNAQLVRMHEKRYNMLAYPWALSYQQSNQWVIETLALAASGANTRSQAQGWLQSKGYEPTPLSINAMTRLGANVTRANIAFDDHPNSKRFSGRIETVTADSVFTWLQRAGLGGNIVLVR
jgi:hypothetical protein